MEGADAGSRAGRVVAGAGSVRREGSHGDAVHQGELSDGVGEEEGGKGKREELAVTGGIDLNPQNEC